MGSERGPRADGALPLDVPTRIDLSRRPEPTPLTATGPHGGPSYTHRGATIDCLPGGHVCRLRMEGHPLDGTWFGAPGTIPYLVDLWLDHRQLPPWIKAAR